MKISIITASFNSENFISTCLDSVINQNYSDYEHIIMDGGSNDKTIEIVNNYKKNNNKLVLYSEPDKGVYFALNKGISYSSGELICFLHTDDFFASNDVLLTVSNTIKKNNFDGVYADLHYVNKFDINKISRKWKSKQFRPSLIKCGWMPPHPTLILKKEVYKNHGFFNTDYSISADYDFIVRVFNDKNLKIDYIPKVFIKMRLGGISNRNLKNLLKKLNEDFKVIQSNNSGNIFTLILKNISKIKQFF